MNTGSKRFSIFSALSSTRSHQEIAVQLDGSSPAASLPMGLWFQFVVASDPPDPTRIRPQPLDDPALGGRGTHLIQMIMDEVCYERMSVGNRLRMSKRLDRGLNEVVAGLSRYFAANPPRKS